MPTSDGESLRHEMRLLVQDFEVALLQKISAYDVQCMLTSARFPVVAENLPAATSRIGSAPDCPTLGNLPSRRRCEETSPPHEDEHCEVEEMLGTHEVEDDTGLVTVEEVAQTHDLADVLLPIPLLRSEVRYSPSGGCENSAAELTIRCSPVSLRPCWLEKVTAAKRLPIAKGSRRPLFQRRSRTQDSLSSDKGNGAFINRIVLEPSSRRRLIWDLVSMFALAYDAITIPLQPFDIFENNFMKRANLGTALFWWLDMYFSFTTGFYHLDKLEMRLSRIARRYLQTGFVLDILVLSVDVFLIVAESSDETYSLTSLGRLGKNVRIYRLMRVLRLLRLQKVMHIFTNFSDSILSLTFSGCLDILQPVLVLLLSMHILACGWYAVGNADTESDTWLKSLKTGDFDGGESLDESFAWLYTSSLQWSISQIHGSMEVNPRNPTERCYAIGAMLTALFMISYLVSRITAVMADVHMKTMESSWQYQLLRQYFVQNKVSSRVSTRILTFLRERQTIDERRKRLHEDEVVLLTSLPKVFGFELHVEVYASRLQAHLLFSYVKQGDYVGFQALCHDTIKEHRLLVDEELFAADNSCSEMYFALHGDYHYIYMCNEFDEIGMQNVFEGDNFCEMCLWVEWNHRGHLVAVNICEAVGLEALSFMAVAKKIQAVASIHGYARDYVFLLQNVLNEFTSDLWVPARDVHLKITQQNFGVVVRASVSHELGFDWVLRRSKLQRLGRSRRNCNQSCRCKFCA